MAKLLVTRMYPDVKLPTTATPMSIGADLYAYLRSEGGTKIKKVIPPGFTIMIPTGIIARAEDPFSIFVCSRSGLAAQRALFVTNSPGVIDPDYTGEIKVLLHNAGHQNQWVEDGDRIAQLVLLPAPFPEVQESIPDLRDTTTMRGERGFGSTGR